MGKVSKTWAGLKEANTAISVLQKFLPGAILTALTGYLTHLWAGFSHLLGVQQFVLILGVVASCLAIWAAGVVLWQYLTPHINVSISAYTTPTSEVIVCVTNNGSEGSFSARATVKLINQDQPPFQLLWQDSPDRVRPIGRDDSANLLIATMEDHIPNTSYRMVIWQLLANVREEFCLSLWNIGDKEPFPNQFVKVIVNSSDKRGSSSRYFVVGPKSHVGPLQVLSFSAEDERSMV